ncbi:hypothetical protein WA026_014497 [Henosepilachna vigintioctopunctata]|uniref:Uncharacterized protein n=1 Tax=Henosepilachna vigintioctopunctata TaxID=420089 RepID=A0AAW1UJ73_9CUCU
MRTILRCDRYIRIGEMLNIFWDYAHFERYLVYCRDIQENETRGRDNFNVKTAVEGIVYNSVFVKGFIRYTELDNNIRNEGRKEASRLRDMYSRT